MEYVICASLISTISVMIFLFVFPIVFKRREQRRIDNEHKSNRST